MGYAKLIFGNTCIVLVLTTLDQIS